MSAGHVLDLPPPSPVLNVLLARVGDPRHSLRDITDVIRRDSVLTATILQLSNSALYARRGSRVGTVDDAAVRIGEIELVRIVIGRLSRWIASADTAGYGLAREMLWRRALLCAVAADEIALRVGEPRGVAFTTGLLLDIGKIALGSLLAQRAGEVRTRLAEQPDESFDAVEAVLLGEDHAEVGARLTEAWRFPDAITQALRFHHRPSEAPQMTRFTALCHVADIVAMQCGAPMGADDMRYRLDEAAFAALDIDDDAYDVLCTTVSRRFVRERSLFHER